MTQTLFTFLYEIPVVIGEKEGKTQNLFIVNKGLLSCQYNQLELLQ